MKKLLTLISVLLIGFNSHSQCSDLFFSEYIEGSSSNKALEIYNPTNATIDMTDYVIYRFNNGSTSATDSLFPLGTLLPNDVFIIGNPSALPTILTLSDTTHTMTFYNGDDAVVLINKTTGDTLDIVGEIGVDPGSGWPVGTGATNNFTLIRQISVQQGETNWTIGATQWDVFPIDMLDSLGGHTMTACCISSSNSITETACNSYTSPSGNYVWTSSNTYMDTIPNAVNCDSVITINLTINNSSSSIINETACESYTSPSGNYVWTSSNTYMDTIPNAMNCDSVITINLTINNSSSSIINETACESYTSPSGNYVWTSSNTYMDTIPNTANCDSVITINLTINTVNTTVTQNSTTLTADAASASYKWLDCDNNLAIISGETNQSFTATINGNYAVEITENSCVDTSACFAISNVGMVENSFGIELLIYPNPTEGHFSIDLGANYESVSITMTDINGKLIQSTTYNESQLLNLNVEEPTGVYLLKIESGDKKAIIRLVKK